MLRSDPLFRYLTILRPNASLLRWSPNSSTLWIEDLIWARVKKAFVVDLTIPIIILSPRYGGCTASEASWCKIEWIEPKSNRIIEYRIHIPAGSVAKCNTTHFMCTMHFIFGCYFSLNKWCYGSEENCTFLRNLRCHRITFVELFAFYNAPPPISSRHVSFIWIGWQRIRKLVDLAWFWLDFGSICSLDTAVGNKDDRLMWLHRLHMMDSKAVDEYKHCHSSIMWLIMRGARATSV